MIPALGIPSKQQSISQTPSCLLTQGSWGRGSVLTFPPLRVAIPHTNPTTFSTLAAQLPINLPP